jgi:hypothetical protein
VGLDTSPFRVSCSARGECTQVGTVPSAKPTARRLLTFEDWVDLLHLLVGFSVIVNGPDAGWCRQVGHLCRQLRALAAQVSLPTSCYRWGCPHARPHNTQQICPQEYPVDVASEARSYKRTCSGNPTIFQHTLVSKCQIL